MALEVFCAMSCVGEASDRIDRRRTADVEGEPANYLKCGQKGQSVGGRRKMAVLTGRLAECTTRRTDGSRERFRRQGRLTKDDGRANERYALKCVKGVSGVAVPNK